MTYIGTAIFSMTCIMHIYLYRLCKQTAETRGHRSMQAMHSAVQSMRNVNGPGLSGFSQSKFKLAANL